MDTLIFVLLILPLALLVWAVAIGMVWVLYRTLIEEDK